MEKKRKNILKIIIIMKFKEAKEKLSTIHKLHTAREPEGETIFYKKPYSAKTLIIKTYDTTIEIFELKNVTHMSLAEEGLLIQYKIVNTNKMHPFTLNNIKDIIVES